MRAGRSGDRARGDQRERGSLSLFTAVFLVSFVVLLGLVVDGAGYLRAQQQVNSVAREAARAGGQAVNAAVAVRGQGTVTDGTTAAGAAQVYLNQAGVGGSASANGQWLTVTAARDYTPIFLGTFGIGPVGVSGSSEARLVRALDGSEQ